jgi:hypothetical protein
LVNHHPTEKAPHVKNFLYASGGSGSKINLDFYWVTFRKHQSQSMEAVFKDLRLNFKRFAQGSDKRNDFIPYESSVTANDSDRVRNEQLWSSNDPKSALMSFVLFQTPPMNPAAMAPVTGLGQPIASFGINGPQVQVVLEQGDVQATCASPTDFIFSVVETDANGMHPVAGNRGFGIKDNGNGTWTFYSKAADRDSGYFMNNFAPANVFALGEAFWDFFFHNMMDYVDSKGMNADRTWTPNSKRYDYPLN